MTSGNDAGNPPGARPNADYTEDHCALNWRFVSAGLLAPVVVIAAAVAGIALGGAAFWALFVVLGLGMMTWIAFGQMLPYAWPLGIRLESDGLRVGGVRWVEQHPGRTRRKATVPRQYGQVFACRWDGVQHIGVTRDRKAIKTSIRHAPHGIRRTPLGNLAVPFMRAAVVILVDLEQLATTVPVFHRRRQHSPASAVAVYVCPVFGDEPAGPLGDSLRWLYGSHCGVWLDGCEYVRSAMTRAIG